MFKGQVKLLVFVKMLSAQYFWLLCLKVAKLVQWMALEKRCSLLIFRSKVKAKLLIFIRSVVYSSSYDPLIDGHQTLLHWLTLLRRFPYCFLDHRVNVKLLVFISALSTQYFMNHLLDNYQTWYSGCWIIHCIQPFWILHQGAFMFLKQFLFK